MLAVLAYHRVGKGKHSNSLAMLDAHFGYIKRNFTTLLPGESYRGCTRSICLTFDDASFDFYYYIFPLLKKYAFKALLAVPTNYILEDTALSVEERLSVPYTMAMQEGIFEVKAPFCTWKELEEMVLSGHVEVAAHSHLHCNLTFPFVDLEREIIQPKKMIEARLKQTVTSFIYPFGRVSKAAHRYVMTHYHYAFRLGFGYNFSWECQKRALKRIVCDQLVSPEAPFRLSAHLRHLFKSLI